MAMGRPEAQVALYLPSSSLWLGDDAADAQFVSTERLLSNIRSTSISSATTRWRTTSPRGMELSRRSAGIDIAR